MDCRSCELKITPFFSLGTMPLVNSFLGERELVHEKRYPLEVGFCPSCFLVQLVDAVPPEELFRTYLYASSVSATVVEHSKKTASTLSERFGLTKDHLVVEAGSNDGVLLREFKALCVRTLGIDPAENIAKIANKGGIETIPEFFTAALARRLSEKGIRADLFFGVNVLAHVPLIRDFVEGVKIVLAPHGSAVFEFPYIEGLFEGKFDTIYHEHVFYYSLLALRNLFAHAGLALYDAHMVDMQGGSVRIFVSHEGIFPESERLTSFFHQEYDRGYDKSETYSLIRAKAEKARKELISLLQDLTSTGKRIAAYSAPAKGNILLNYFGIGKNYLDYIVDKSPAKQGLYTPGTHMKVFGLDKITEMHPDYLIVLCWNIYPEVLAMKELELFRRRGGKFIIPVPKVKIV